MLKGLLRQFKPCKEGVELLHLVSKRTAVASRTKAFLSKHLKIKLKARVK